MIPALRLAVLSALALLALAGPASAAPTLVPLGPARLGRRRIVVRVRRTSA